MRLKKKQVKALDPFFLILTTTTFVNYNVNCAPWVENDMSKFAPHSRSGNNPRATSSTVCQKCLRTGSYNNNTLKPQVWGFARGGRMVKTFFFIFKDISHTNARILARTSHAPRELHNSKIHASSPNQRRRSMRCPRNLRTSWFLATTIYFILFIINSS